MLLLLWRVSPVLRRVDYYTCRMRLRLRQLSKRCQHHQVYDFRSPPDVPRLTSGTHALTGSNRVFSYDALDRTLPYRVSRGAGV